LRSSRLLGALGCCLLLGACADTSGLTQEAYVVRPQDTLYSIAWRYSLDYHDLARWNRIGPDFRIEIGQTLILAPPSSREAGIANVHAPPPKFPAARLVNKAPTSGASASSSGLSWVWPTDRLTAPQPVTGGGILISGTVGQDVRAAASGRVVYNGNGIRGYGNLIIIKHSENLLSAYAHNRESLIHEGQEVAMGQVIGHMGEGAPSRPILYFEIRRNGKPIDPLPFLPVIK
jgi:lipoprotein NlpD